MEPKHSKVRPQLQQADYFNGCSTAAEVELRFGELIHFLEEHTPNGKAKKQLARTAQTAIPRLMDTYKSLPGIAAQLVCASLLIVCCCEYRPADWAHFAQQMLEPLSNVRIDKTLQLKIAHLLDRSRILIDHYSRDTLALYLETMARCSKNYREVGDCLLESVTKVLNGKEAEAMDCLLSLLALSEAPSVKDTVQCVFESQTSRQRIDYLLGKSLEQKLWLPSLAGILHLNIHANFLNQLAKEPYSKYLLGLLEPLVTAPQLPFFVRFQSFYNALVKDPELPEHTLLAATKILSLRWKMQQTSITESNEKAVFTLQTISEELEKRMVEATTANKYLLLKLEGVLHEEPEIFSLKCYRELFAVDDIRAKLMQIVGFVLNKAYNNHKEVWEVNYPFVDLYIEAVNNFDSDSLDFKHLMFELSYTSFMKINSHLFIEFFKESLVAGFESRLRLIERFFAGKFYVWRKLIEKSVCQTNAANWFAHCSVTSPYLSQWFEKHTQATLDYLKVLIDKRNIKGITALWNLVCRSEIKPDIARIIIPYLISNFDSLVSLFSDKETAFNKVVYQDNIQWSEHHYKIYIEQRELEKKMSRVLIQSIVRVLAQCSALHRYLPENYGPETLSQRLLRYQADNPSHKGELYGCVLRVLGRLEHVSSMHLFARQVHQPLKKMQLHRHIDLTTHASCLKELAYFKCDFPEMTLEWSWRALCECALTFIRLNLKDFSIERDVLQAKVLSLQACEIILPNIKDSLLAKDLLQQIIRLFEMNNKSVHMEELGLLMELRCQAIRTAAQLGPVLFKHKKQYVEYAHLMQTAIMDQSEELRLTMLWMAISGDLTDTEFLMVLASADPNPIFKKLCSTYLNFWFEAASPCQIANLVIHLLFFLTNSTGIARRDQFATILSGHLNDKSIMYALEAAELLKDSKIAICSHLPNHRTVHGRKSQGVDSSSNERKPTEQPPMAHKEGIETLEQLKKRAKALKVKTAKIKLLELKEHPLLDSV